MDIGASTMATLIDEGLVEGSLDDAVGVIDLEQLSFIDIDSIDATIEDPGYILEEESDTLNQNEVKPSDKKRSFALPVTFFDINSNITLLKKCRPISIKIVDCNIFPWYYRNNKHTVKSCSAVYKTDEDLVPDKLRYDSTDLIDLTYDTHVNDQVNATPINLPKINLTPEQRSVVLKLKEDIDEQMYLNEAYDDTIIDVHTEAVPSKHDEDLTNVNHTSEDVNASECSFDNTIEFHDLLTYKEIAQTIVRTIDNNTVSNKTDNINVQNQNTNTNNSFENNISVNVEDSLRDIPEENKEERTHISTSPILPYTIKRQKKTKSKEKILSTPPKEKGIVERCIDFNKNCNKFMSSVNQIIPHYHCRQFVEANNNNNFMSMVANPMHFQEQINKNSSLHCHQQFNKKDIFSDNSGSFRAYNSGGRLVTKSSNIADASYSGASEELRTNSVFNSSEMTKDQFKIQNGKSLRFIRRSVKQLSNESRGTIPQTSIPRNIFYDDDPPNSYVDYSSMRIPMQCQVRNVTSTIQRNPVLTQILDTYDIRKSYQPVQVYSGLHPRPVIASTPYPSMGQNIRLPPRQPLPVPSYVPYCPPTPYTPGENVQCSNTGTLLKDFEIMEDRNSFQDKTKSSIKNLGSTNNPWKYNNTPKCTPIDPPKVTVSMTTRVDSAKQNIYPQSEMQSIGTASPEVSRNINPKMLIDTNDKINQQNIIQVSVKPNVTNNVKNNTKNNLDTMINVLSNKKSDCLSSRVHKSCSQKKIKQQYGIPEMNQLATKSKVAGVSKTSYTIVHLAKIKDTCTPEKVEFKINGYSPPILPIPSFKKSLEMLSGIDHSRKLPGNHYFEADANKTLEICKDRRKKQDFTNITRKRKLFIEERVCGTSKRISLQEYKQRRSVNNTNI